MGKSFRVEIVTPYGVFYSGTAESVVIRSVDGDLELLADHEPIVTVVSIGTLRLLSDGSWKKASVAEGFLEMDRNSLTILVGAAEWPDGIDAARARRAQERALERLAHDPLPGEKRRSTLALRRAETRLRIATELAAEAAAGSGAGGVGRGAI